MSTAGATDEVPESPAKKPKLASDRETEENDDDFYADGLHEMTEQESVIYAEAIRRSDGFDVPWLPGICVMGLIQPACAEWPAEDIREFAELAIEDQNEKRKKEGVGNQLQLTEVIKCNLQAAGPLNYYITLEARDTVTGEVDVYEAMVCNYCGEKDEVYIFRKKKTKSANHPPASSTDQHGPSGSDCAVEDLGKICEA